MASGLSRTEQYALIGLIGLIALGMVVHGLRPDSEVSVAPGKGEWEKIGVVTADGHARINTDISKPAATLEKRIDLNSAGMTELDRLPGIGAARAKAIIELREKVGGFHSVEQLDEIKGIGKAGIEKLRPLVKIDPTSATALPAGMIE